MQNTFTQEMIRRTDAELIAIVTSDRNDYMPAAIAAAEAEVQRRGLTYEQRETLQAESVERRRQKEVKAEAPLSIGLKIFAFFVPFFASIVLIIMGFMVAKGYNRRAREFGRWILYGFGFYIVLWILLNVL
jgi:hypothetical protein